jgi:membrane associated rhomboid family serine protease
MPAVIQLLLIVNVLGFLLAQAAGPQAFDALALWIDPAAPLAAVLTAPWQLVTYSLLHVNVAHLALNLFGLWMFGSDVARVWAPKRVLLAYFAAVLTGGLAHVLAATVFGGGGPVVGASAGVFGLLLCFGMMFPDRRVMLLIPPIPMSARTMVIGYALVELAFGVTGTQSGVAHFAHLGGLLGGWLVYRYGGYLNNRRWR